MNLEELGFKKNDNSEKNNKLDHLGLIIFFVLAIFFVVLSTHYELNGMEAFGRVTAYGLLFFLPWFFIKRKKNASNISVILPLILIIAAFPKLIITGEENKISLIQIESFQKGLLSIDRKFSHLRDSRDKTQRGKFFEKSNNYIDSYLRKSNSKSREIINKVKIYRNEFTNSQEIWITSLTKIEELIVKKIYSEGSLNFSDQDLKDINFFINSSGKMIELYDNEMMIKDPRQNDIRKKYFLIKNVGLKLKKVAETYFSYLNNEITEARYKKSIEKALNKFTKSQENLNNVIQQNQ